MHHTRAKDLKPVVTLADFQLPAGPRTPDIDFGRGFSEREMRSAKPQFDIIDLEKCFDKLFQYPFQICHRDVFVDRKPFDLMKHWRVGLIIVRAVHATRANYTQRRTHFFHRAHLNRRGMGAQNMRRAIVALGTMHIKRVHLGTRRMVAGNVQSIKIIPISVDPWALGNPKAHIRKNRRHFFADLTYRMEGALPSVTRWQCDIKPFSLKSLIERSIRQRRFLGRQGAVDLIFQRVQFRAGTLALLWGHLAQFTHFQADFTFFANCLQAQVFQRHLVLCCHDGSQIFISQIIHAGSPLAWHPAITSAFLRNHLGRKGNKVRKLIFVPAPLIFFETQSLNHSPTRWF